MSTESIETSEKKSLTGGENGEASAHANVVGASTPEPGRVLLTMSTGWVKLYRQFIDWQWYTDPNAKAVFIHCLLMANVEKKEWRGISIDRGSFITSIGKLAIDLGLTYKAVRVAIEKLKRGNEIECSGASQWTTITVCKYDTYQSGINTEGRAKGEQQGEQGANEGRTKGERRATTKNIKNIRIKEGKNITTDAIAPGDREAFLKFQKWIFDNAPRVADMKNPFTVSEFIAAKKSIPTNEITTLLTEMHNYKPLLSKNVSAYLTLCNWHRRRRESGQTNVQHKQLSAAEAADKIDRKWKETVEGAR